MDINIVINIIIGLVIGVLLSYWIRPVIKYKGPNSNDIRKNLYKHEGKCYRLVPKVYMCGK